MPTGSSISPDAAAKSAFAAGNYEEAARLYSALLERRPDATEQRHLLLCNRSAALMKMSRFEEAANDARAAIETAPEGFVKAHYRLACALRGGGDYAGALAECNRALQIRPGNDQIQALREACVSEMAEQVALTGAPVSNEGMLERARRARQNQAAAAAAAGPARAGMLDRARAARNSCSAGGAAESAAPGAAAPSAADAACARSGMLERARAAAPATAAEPPAGAARGGMLERARAAKQGADGGS